MHPMQYEGQEKHDTTMIEYRKKYMYLTILYECVIPESTYKWTGNPKLDASGLEAHIFFKIITLTGNKPSFSR